jgi:septal ring factor EnvC (AmiA/AmiB activator)
MIADAIERLRDTMAGQTGGGMTCMDADDARAILDHIAALTASLKAANNNHEHFEREWYLRGDEIERLTAERDAAVAAVNRQANAVRALHANEETEINRLRKQRHEWHHAVSSLDSEREANARLTEEIERLTAERDAAVAANSARPAIVRIDPAEYQDGLYLNPVTGAVMWVAAHAPVGGKQ